MAENVADAAALLEIISGHDAFDSTSLNKESYDFSGFLNDFAGENTINGNALNINALNENALNENALNENALNGNALNINISNKIATNEIKVDNISNINNLKGLKIGIPVDYLGDGLDDEIRESIYKTKEILEKAGAIVSEFEMGMFKYSVPAYYIIACAEASSNLERYDGVKYGLRAKDYSELHSMYKKSRSQGFGAEVKKRIMLGSFLLSSGYYDAYYIKALKTRELIKQCFENALNTYDCILLPVSPSTAPRLGESLKNPLKMYLSDVYNVSANLCGLPAIVFPAGESREGLPIGLQFIGRRFGEQEILYAAATCEAAGRGPESKAACEAHERGVV
ncbi:MAG: hypothetical protein K6G11_00955 [Lachnospiraceae bacterium]|nr:hypothetical protein [Lachnospiraceae bacterium]